MGVRRTFTLSDLLQECAVEEGCYSLDGSPFGLRVSVPAALHKSWPYCADGYDYLQFLRADIGRYGVIEFPRLPVNKLNYTLAQRAPHQHRYSANSFLTDDCQEPHQDTPPYPSAFWLPAERRFFATWLLSKRGFKRYRQQQLMQPDWSVSQLHQYLQAASLEQGWGLLVNQQPGLALIDNSVHRQLYHARTCNYSAQQRALSVEQDTVMYAFNEVGLLRYIDQIDERRGDEARDAGHAQQVAEFMRREPV